MSRFLLSSSVLAVAGAALGHRLWGWMPLDVHFLVVGFLGGIAALSTTLAFQTIRKADDLAKVSGLDPERRATFQRTSLHRRQIIKHRFYLALVSGLGAVAAAGALKTPLVHHAEMYLIWAAYGLVVLSAVSNAAQFSEHEKLSKLLVDTEAALQREAEEREFYRGVTRDDVVPSQ